MLRRRELQRESLHGTAHRGMAMPEIAIQKTDELRRSFSDWVTENRTLERDAPHGARPRRAITVPGKTRQNAWLQVESFGEGAEVRKQGATDDAEASSAAVGERARRLSGVRVAPTRGSYHADPIRISKMRGPGGHGDLRWGQGNERVFLSHRFGLDRRALILRIGGRLFESYRSAMCRVVQNSTWPMPHSCLGGAVMPYSPLGADWATDNHHRPA